MSLVSPFAIGQNNLTSVEKTKKGMSSSPALLVPEPLENSEFKRYTIFPLRDNQVWELYKKAQELFWVEEEVDSELAKDPKDWETLEAPIKHFIEHILAFFAVSDGIVNETLVEEILSRVQQREVRFWYDFQIMMEDIHNTVYSKLIDTYIKDPTKKAKLFNAIETYPAIRKKIEWVRRWLGKGNELAKLSDEKRAALLKLEKMYDMVKGFQSGMNGMLSDAPSKSKNVKKDDLFDSSPAGESALETREPANDIERLFSELHVERPSLAKQILINTIMEGIFFSGSFCAIFWIYSTMRKLPGLAKANEFISRDEGMHTEFGIHLYRNKIKNRLPQKEVFEIVAEAVEVEAEFIRSALPKGLLGMNAELMTQYIQFVADQLLVQLGYQTYFKSTNPFPFMNKQSTSVRIPDFFMDQAVSEYGHHSAGSKVEDNTLDFSEDF
jgi:ribonucleoside-diphosphate reductase beta chain